MKRVKLAMKLRHHRGKKEENQKKSKKSKNQENVQGTIK